ncbi:MAG: sodium-dependent bicarbonate transport family permease [Fimbriimonadaceae bacterium]|nr:sodium-dependent bicarbonate transport family permease [Fimbriimonadaceae bacterium]
MNALDLVRGNLLTPMVLAYALGFFGGLAKTELKPPKELTEALSMYLLLAIGLKGGVALSSIPLASVAWPLLATLVVGLLTPVIGFGAARLGKLDTVNASAFAAHYGSVSAVTFVAASSFAEKQFAALPGYMPTLLAVLEIPAIAMALLIATRAKTDVKMGPALREILSGKSTALLVGGLLIGWLVGAKGIEPVKPVFYDLFPGALMLFLLDLGLVASEQIDELRRKAVFILAYGIVVPLINGCIGAVIGHSVGMSAAGITIFSVMAASASYIAAPAAVRAALPEANASLPLAGSLAVTFPFNLAIGIPMFAEIATRLTR